MLFSNSILLEYAAYVIQLGGVGVTPTSLTAHQEVPTSSSELHEFYQVLASSGCGQDFYLWADDCGGQLLVVMPGIGIFEAEWLRSLWVNSEHPALGVVAHA